MSDYLAIETPFKFRHHCWFCGEPSNQLFCFPQTDNFVPDCPHPPIALPTCKECLLFANKCYQPTIWQVKSEVKKRLIKRYQKHLAIGINWTKQELEESGFEHGNFASFQKSAWLMYEIARDRVNFSGWQLQVNGLVLDDEFAFVAQKFSFDGIDYPSLEEAVKHYALAFSLHIDFVKQVLTKVGLDNFAFAIRFCRLQVGSTPQERAYALRMLDVK